MTWKFWQWFRSPKVNVKLVDPKVYRVGLALQGAAISGWYIEEDYMKFAVCGAGTVTCVHITIDHLIIHTMRTKRSIPVNSGDTLCFSLVEFVREHIQVKNEDHCATAPTLPCS